MSIATLKRKSLVQYNNMSVGQPTFSLNGTRRSAGYVGQDMLGRSLVRSLSRGGALKGHGGCCGKYPVPEIKTSPEMVCLNNPKIVKSSSLNNTGRIMTKYRWIRRPHPYTSVKQDATRNINNQAYYIDYLAKKTIATNCHDASGNTTVYRFTRNCKSLCPYITKSVEFYSAARPYSEYIRKLNLKCANMDEFKLYKNSKSVPFGCKANISRNT